MHTNVMFPPGKFTYRAVLIKDNNEWYLLRHSVMFEDLEEPFGAIHDSGREYQVLAY